MPRCEALARYSMKPTVGPTGRRPTAVMRAGGDARGRLPFRGYAVRRTRSVGGGPTDAPGGRGRSALSDRSGTRAGPRLGSPTLGDVPDDP